MSIRSFSNVELIENRVVIRPADHKPQGMTALSMLERIESIMQSGEIQRQATQETWEDLKTQARWIGYRYCSKTGEMGRLRRYLFKIKEKESLIKAAIARIENIPFRTTFSLLSLSTVPFQNLLSFLPIPDLGHVANLCIEGKRQVEINRFQKAKAYGYEGESRVEAQEYLRLLFQTVSALHTYGILPFDCLRFYEENGPLNVEATFLEMQRCFEIDQTVFREPFSNHLRTVIANTLLENAYRIFQVQFLLKYGADPNAKHNSYTILGDAFNVFFCRRINEHVEADFAIIRLLIKNGANPTLKNFYNSAFQETVWGWNFNPYMPQLLTEFCESPLVTQQHLDSTLDIAIRNFYWSRARVLLEKGANPFYRNRQGQTIFQELNPFWKFCLWLGLLRLPNRDALLRSARGENN